MEINLPSFNRGKPIDLDINDKPLKKIKPDVTKYIRQINDVSVRILPSNCIRLFALRRVPISIDAGNQGTYSNYSIQSYVPYI